MTSIEPDLVAPAATSPLRDHPRQRRRRALRRRRRRRALLAVSASTAVLALVAGIWALVGPRHDDPDASRPSAAAPAAVAPTPAPPGGTGARGAADADGQRTVLLVTVAGTGRASSATLFATGPEDAPATALFVPVRTLLEVPGVGLDRLELTARYGGGDLLGATVDNALGIVIDEVVVVDLGELAELLSAAGPLTVDASGELSASSGEGSADVRANAGSAVLDGARLAELWSHAAEDADELSTLPRRQQILEALLTALAEQRGGEPPSADIGAMGLQLDLLADAHRRSQLTFDVLPVEPFGGDDEGGVAYRLDEVGAAAVVSRRLAASTPGEQTAGPLRVQVLNGVGTPGVGAVVDDRLGGTGARVVLTDNARSFDFDLTQIVVYDDGEAALEAAALVREHLGVGSIRVSRQPQSVVDVTIVVGRDLAGDGP